MDFLYRMPLVDFNPLDQNQIEQHWNWIQEAIRLSSESLFQEIFGKEYKNLGAEARSKIIKYLIRGRYRPTPFGLWAGVGLGTWGENSSVECPVQYKKIEEAQAIEDTGIAPISYKKAPGLREFSDQVHYWSYCPEEGGWRTSYLEKNPLVLRIINHFQDNKRLDYLIFQSFFESKKQSQIQRIWQMLLQSGLIIPENFPLKSQSGDQSGVDIRITSALQVNRSILEKIETLKEELGNWVVPLESEFLQDLKSWFTYQYDDRFVPLSMLDHIRDFQLNSESSSSNKMKNESFIPLTALFKNEPEIDLSMIFPAKKLEVQNLQVAFRMLGEDDLYIENLVFNRPFAYTGRFSLDPEVKAFSSRQIPSGDSSVVYADLILFESSKSNHICRHSNLFDYSIDPFGESLGQTTLGTEDLLLGYREGRLVLYSTKLRKEVIPMVQHPLNPNQITHPLSRLLWEIGHQDQLKFLPYLDQAFQTCDYLPRLTWKGIILQGRRWVIHSKKHGDKESLLHHLKQAKLPGFIVAGHLDRELVIDWKDPQQLGFLWTELRRLDQIHVYECPWLENSPFKTPQNTQLYPQIMVSLGGSRKGIVSTGFINKLHDTDPNWVYARIFISEVGLLPFLHSTLPSFVQDLKDTYPIEKWYYLIYNSPKSEIRLRVLPENIACKTWIELRLLEHIQKSGWVQSIRMDSYHPEVEKYGGLNHSIEESESLFHRESEWMLLGEPTYDIQPILSYPESIRRNWMINRYFRMILSSKIQDHLFRFVKEWIKTIPVSDRKHLTKIELLSEETSELTLCPILFESRSLIEGRTTSELLRIIPNHIHLCCNRAFPMNTSQEEQQVMYGIYKKLGKAIYGQVTSL